MPASDPSRTFVMRRIHPLFRPTSDVMPCDIKMVCELLLLLSSETRNVAMALIGGRLIRADRP